MELRDFDLLPRKKTTVGLPKTPATWVGEPTYTEIMRIKVTCGGGMGGSSWYEYVDRHDFKTVNVGGVEMVKYKRYNGEKVTLNPHYIVTIQNFTLFTAIYDSRNSNFDIGKYTLYYLVEDGRKIKLVDSFDSRG